MALSPGGFAIMICMPIVGWLLSRYDARYLLVFGLSMLSFSLFHMTNFDLSIDFKTAVYRPCPAGSRLGFLVRADQYVGLCVPAEREKQCGLRTHEPGTQHWRQCRDFVRDDHAGPPNAKALE